MRKRNEFLKATMPFVVFYHEPLNRKPLYCVILTRYLTIARGTPTRPKGLGINPTANK
jgi:hypothetical protein